MEKHNIFFYILVTFVFLCCLRIYYESDAYNLKCIISDVDGERYCVRESSKMELAADLLATVTKNCKNLVAYCAKKFPDDEKVQRLVQKFNPTKISETLPTSEYTAYSENKGEKLAFCLNKKKNQTKLIDINTLTFVAVHELAHIWIAETGISNEVEPNLKQKDTFHPVELFCNEVAANALMPQEIILNFDSSLFQSSKDVFEN
jgi:hypothetical protein